VVSADEGGVDQEVQSGWPGLRIRLFGELTIDDGERTLGPKDLGGLRPKQVLEILLAARGHRVPTERLAEILWGDEPPGNAAASIQTFVSVLRRALVADRATARRLVVTEASAYRFATELIEFDLDVFDRLVARAKDEPPWVARRSLENAVCLARGDVLEDEPYADWANELRRDYQLRTLRAHLDGATIALGERDYSAALAHAEAAAVIDRFSEASLRTAMLALYAEGRQHDALARYRAFRAALDRELGLTPSEAVRSLEAAILRDADPQTLLPRPIARPRSHLSDEPLPLLGRAEQLETLEAAARDALDESFALIQIEGESGVGKTRMLDELDGALAGVRVGRATCSWLEQHLSYVPLAAALRDAGVQPDPARCPALARVLPEFTVQDANSFDEIVGLEALVALIYKYAPIVIMLDDLQFADMATISALNYLQRRCRGVRGAVVSAVTTEQTPAYHPVRGLHPDTVIALSPFTPSDLEPIGIPGLFESTGGNPRFVADALANGNSSGPSGSLAETVLAQIWQEGPRAHRILVAAALLEPPFEPDQIEAMLGAELHGIADSLETLCQRRILRADGFGFRFNYDLVREVVLQSLSPGSARVLKERLAPVHASDYQ
jgi:DNA-binding SARP family transcriptional activator